jgi:dihydrolipoamide dehydrogenase
MTKVYDIAVIGGGPAGYVAAIKGAQMGAGVILFEMDKLGGTCLNRGCVPTKTYMKTAEYLHHIRQAASRGIQLDLSSVHFDMAQAVEHKNKVVQKLRDGIAKLLVSNKVEVVRGKAELLETDLIACEGQQYRAKSIILAGGSRETALPIEGIGSSGVLNSSQMLDITAVPRRLAVIGGGVIGCEMASAMTHFGSSVTIVELTDRLVPAADAEISSLLRKNLEKQGIKIFAGRKVTRISEESGSLGVMLDDGTVLGTDSVLVSVGRSADLACLGNLRERCTINSGFVQTDDRMMTSIPGIYAAGDINGRSMLAHAAFKMGEMAAINAAGGNVRADLDHVPSCIYTLPEAAWVGMTEEQAKAKHDICVGRFPLSANSRAMASGDTEGMIKVITDKKYGEILGVHIFGGPATELISECAALRAMEITAHEAADIIHAHPTYSEAFAEACADALGQAIHLMKK